MHGGGPTSTIDANRHVRKSVTRGWLGGAFIWATRVEKSGVGGACVSRGMGRVG